MFCILISWTLVARYLCCYHFSSQGQEISLLSYSQYIIQPNLFFISQQNADETRSESEQNAEPTRSKIKSFLKFVRSPQWKLYMHMVSSQIFIAWQSVLSGLMLFDHFRKENHLQGSLSYDNSSILPTQVEVPHCIL